MCHKTLSRKSWKKLDEENCASLKDCLDSFAAWQGTLLSSTSDARESSAIREDKAAAEHLPDPAPSQLDEILSEEKSRIVHQVINELRIERDRELLRRYYIAEEDKDRICAALSLTRAQFNNVISRAKARFKDLYMQRSGPRDG